MKSSVRLVAGLVSGCIAASAIALAGFATLRTLWPAYAAAEPDKAYALAMLLSRLALGVLGTAVAACVATLVAFDERRVAWWLGAVFVAISTPDHLYPGYVWNDYPMWYHVAYLSYLVPVASLAGRLCRGTMLAYRVDNTLPNQRMQPAAFGCCGVVRAAWRRG